MSGVEFYECEYHRLLTAEQVTDEYAIPAETGKPEARQKKCTMMIQMTDGRERL